MIRAFLKRNDRLNDTRRRMLHDRPPTTTYDHGFLGPITRTVDAHLCEDCDVDKAKVQTSKVGPPKPYEFNHTIGVDVFDLHDYDGNVHLFLNIELV